jgi:dynein heavy chain
MAKEASNALEGMCIWAQAMRDYHEQSKIVNPKLKLLEIKDANLREAEANAAAAEAELSEVKAFQAKLKAEFDESQAVVQGLQDKAMKTKRKMDQASRLISSLDDNKVRWEKNAENFKKEKKALVGDVAKACAFVSYCGPFNAEFRRKLLNDYFHSDLVSREIPRTEDLQLTDFLVDPATLGSWSL